MKYIIYQIDGHTSLYDPTTEEVQEVSLLAKVEMPWSEANEEIAKAEAYNGEYEIYDDGQPEPVAEPTADEVLNAMLGVM